MLSVRDCPPHVSWSTTGRWTYFNCFAGRPLSCVTPKPDTSLKKTEKTQWCELRSKNKICLLSRSWTIFTCWLNKGEKQIEEQKNDELQKKKLWNLTWQLFPYPIVPVTYVASCAGKHMGITDDLNVIGSCSLIKAMSLLKVTGLL